MTSEVLILDLLWSEAVLFAHLVDNSFHDDISSAMSSVTVIHFIMLLSSDLGAFVVDKITQSPLLDILGTEG